MDEQPVALATTTRSPKSCVSSLMYGFSPHPAHAPENSNSGSRNCDSLTSRFSFARSNSGRRLKKAQFSFSDSRRGGCGCMSTALCLGLLLSFAGQTMTHRLHPVQSSGATWSRYFRPLNSWLRKSADLKVGGAPSKAPGATMLARMTAWGQTKTHLLHWMQIAGSHTGISSAMLRRSHWLVPTGQVPSGEKALTGSQSPLLAIIMAVTLLTKSGASSGTMGGSDRAAVTRSGTFTSYRLVSVSSTAWKLRRTTSSPLRP